MLKRVQHDVQFTNLWAINFAEFRRLPIKREDKNVFANINSHQAKPYFVLCKNYRQRYVARIIYFQEIVMAVTAEDKIIKAMKKVGGPMRPGEIAEAAGLDKADVSKAMKKLAADGKVTSPKRCFWQAV